MRVTRTSSLTLSVPCLENGGTTHFLPARCLSPAGVVRGSKAPRDYEEDYSLCRMSETEGQMCLPLHWLGGSSKG